MYVNISYIGRLYNRLKLRVDKLFPEAVSFLPQIIAVLAINDLLYDSRAASSTGDLTGGGSAYVPIHTVPTGKRWTLKYFQRESSTANSAVAIVLNSQRVSLCALGTVTVTQHSLDIIMEQGDTIGMYETGDVGDSAIHLDIIYNEEEAFAYA